MRHSLTLFLSVLFVIGITTVSAQGFSDDFESYVVSDYLAANSTKWETWSGGTGGADDVQIVDTKAYSGSNSIYFQSNATAGGPDDIVLPFEGEQTTGQLTFEMMMYVTANNGAYFNFQADDTIGTTWALDCQMVDDGKLYLENQIAGLLVETTFPFDTWFEVKFEIELNTNVWKFYIDENLEGTFQNGNNRVASLDLYPVNQSHGGNESSEFWVDDVSYQYTPYTPTARNAAVSYINVNGLATQQVTPTTTIRNLGTTDITSFDVTVDYNGNQQTETISNITIGPSTKQEIELSNQIALIAGNNPVSITVSNVNGNGADDHPADDMKEVYVDPVVPGTGKIVVAEEATGTWCQWCPRGAVGMDYMAETYEGHYAGIAVHNGDPMVYPAYDDGIGPLISGYPSALVDRGDEIDPAVGTLESNFMERIIVQPVAVIENGAIYNADSASLSVSLKVDFNQATSGEWRLACVLTEDSVTGTAQGYAQINAYAGGSNGPMGGYENLPNPVPASQMVYNHVARVISPSFEGDTVFPSAIESDLSQVTNYEFTIDSEWEADQMHIIGLLIAPDGSIENGSTTTIAQAEQNGWNQATSVTEELTIPDQPDRDIMVYPNPSSGKTFVKTNYNDGSIQIMDLTGKQLQNYPIPESGTIQLQNEGIPKGVYLLNVISPSGQKLQSERLVFN